MPDNSRTRQSRLRIRSIANKLLAEAKISHAPVYIHSIYSHLNIDLIKADAKYVNLNKISAFIDLESKMAFYNPDHSIVRQRFSTAHELGHLMLKHSVGVEIFNLNSTDVREVEANMFAAELLIPYKWIKEDLRDQRNTIKILAQKYIVSEEAMGWRLFQSERLL
jgi:Zn-dependent peptidase ImmA (M78 family)